MSEPSPAAPAPCPVSVPTSREPRPSSNTQRLQEAPGRDGSQQQVPPAAILTLPSEQRSSPQQQRPLFGSPVWATGGGEAGWVRSPSVRPLEWAQSRWSGLSTPGACSPCPSKLTWTPRRETGRRPRVRLSHETREASHLTKLHLPLVDRYTQFTLNWNYQPHVCKMNEYNDLRAYSCTNMSPERVKLVLILCLL